MKKSNKIEKPLDNEDEEIIGIEEEDDFDENTIDNALEIGGQIHIQSPIISNNFKHLPKDLKYSRFGKIDLASFILKSSTYQLWKYIRKIQFISKDELSNIKEKRKKLYDVTTQEEFKLYLESIGKSYIWYSFKELDEKEFKEKFNEMLKQLKYAKDEGIVNLVYADKENFYEAYTSYLESENGESKEIDDFGLVNSMMTLIESKKAHGGWGMGMMNTTINVTKEENPSQEQEEEPESREVQSRGIGSYFKK